MPAGFQPASVTFVSPRTGFVLGAVPCAGKTCTALVTTSDAGAHWAQLADLPTPLASVVNDAAGMTGITTVRFATPSQGWAFGPQLWATHDGGLNWTQLRQPGPVDDVEAAGGRAYALVHSCASEPCATGERLLSAAVGSDTWTPVAAVPAPARAFALHGHAAWVITGDTPQSQHLVQSSDGVSWRTLPAPCASLGAQWSALAVAPVSSSALFALCPGGAAAGSQMKKVLFSTDAGAHFVATHGDPPFGGDATGLAAARPSIVAVSASSGASWIYRSADAGATWTAPLTNGDGGVGYYDVGFTTPTQGVAVHGRPGMDSSTQLFMTSDAGASWHAVAF